MTSRGINIVWRNFLILIGANPTASPSDTLVSAVLVRRKPELLKFGHEIIKDLWISTPREKPVTPILPL
jgi:hypothetical protein